MKYALKNSDGTVGIFIIAPEALNHLTKQEILNKCIPIETPYREITDGELPANRLFRNAWTDDLPGSTVDVDLEKAKDIHLDRLRVMRDKKLKELDGLEFKYLGQGDGDRLTQLRQLKQKLRDLPETLDLANAKSPEELLKLWDKDVEKPRVYKN